MKALVIIFYLTLLLMALAVLAWYVVGFGKRNIANERQCDADYRVIDSLIASKEVNEWNYDSLLGRIENLKRLPFKNREKTDVLVAKFCKKFGKV